MHQIQQFAGTNGTPRLAAWWQHLQWKAREEKKTQRARTKGHPTVAMDFLVFIVFHEFSLFFTIFHWFFPVCFIWCRGFYPSVIFGTIVVPEKDFFGGGCDGFKWTESRGNLILWIYSLFIPVIEQLSHPVDRIKRVASNITPRKFNITPKNRQSQKETHLPTIIFQGLC